MTSLSIQLGARSLMNLGVSLGDIGALIQHGRAFGNWLRTKQNDEDLFESMSEVYGEVLRRRGLVDTTLMANRWAQQMHFYYQGDVVHETPACKSIEEQSMGSFSWLMVTLVTALDTCLPQYGFLPLLIKVFIRILGRDDVDTLTESLQIQLQTNIESWRSTGRIRGMAGPIAQVIRTCRLRLVGEDVMPKLNRAESEELCDFLVWLMAGSATQYQLFSATLLAVADGMRSAGLELVIGERKTSFEGQLVIHYAGKKESLGDFLRLLDINEESADAGEKRPPPQISFPHGEPWKMIEAMPRPIDSKNRMEKFWAMGARAATAVKIKATSCGRWDIRYVIGEYDKCTSRWPGILTGLADIHFPVTSETLLQALNNLHNESRASGDDLTDWLSNYLPFVSAVPNMSWLLKLTEKQMDCLLCYQCLVFGYWYQLIDSLISIRYTDTDVYLTSLWGFRDAYLIKAVESVNYHMRACVNSDLDPLIRSGAGRDEMIRLVGIMYAGRPAELECNINTLKQGLLALLGNISVVCMSMFCPSDDVTEIGKFVILTLPILDMLQDRGGELWAGKPTGIALSHEPRSSVQKLEKVRAKKTWSVHPKGCLIDGCLSGVVLAARCDGVLVGTFDPVLADCVMIANSNRPIAENSLSGEATSGYIVTELDFQQGLILRPIEDSTTVLVQSYGNPIMRYAAAGFLGREDNLVIGGHSITRDLCRLEQQRLTDLSKIVAGIIIG